MSRQLEKVVRGAGAEESKEKQRLVFELVRLLDEKAAFDDAPAVWAVLRLLLLRCGMTDATGALLKRYLRHVAASGDPRRWARAQFAAEVLALEHCALRGFASGFEAALRRVQARRRADPSLLRSVEGRNRVERAVLLFCKNARTYPERAEEAYDMIVDPTLADLTHLVLACNSFDDCVAVFREKVRHRVDFAGDDHKRFGELVARSRLYTSLVMGGVKGGDCPARVERGVRQLLAEHGDAVNVPLLGALMRLWLRNGSVADVDRLALEHDRRGLRVGLPAVATMLSACVLDARRAVGGCGGAGGEAVPASAEQGDEALRRAVEKARALFHYALAEGGGDVGYSSYLSLSAVYALAGEAQAADALLAQLLGGTVRGVTGAVFDHVAAAYTAAGRPVPAHVEQQRKRVLGPQRGLRRVPATRPYIPRDDKSCSPFD